LEERDDAFVIETLIKKRQDAKKTEREQWLAEDELEVSVCYVFST